MYMALSMAPLPSDVARLLVSNPTQSAPDIRRRCEDGCLERLSVPSGRINGGRAEPVDYVIYSRASGSTTSAPHVQLQLPSHSVCGRES